MMSGGDCDHQRNIHKKINAEHPLVDDICVSLVFGSSALLRSSFLLVKYLLASRVASKVEQTASLASLTKGAKLPIFCCAFRNSITAEVPEGKTHKRRKF
jgi:hypothetical protein